MSKEEQDSSDRGAVGGDAAALERSIAEGRAERDRYLAKVRSCVAADVEFDGAVLAALPVTRVGLRLNKWDVRGFTVPFQGLANLRREASNRAEAAGLGFPDARLMVLVATEARLLVYRQRPLVTRGSPWALPGRFVGALPLTDLAGVRVDRGFDGDGAIHVVFSDGRIHSLQQWNDVLASQLGAAINARIADL